MFYTLLKAKHNATVANIYTLLQAKYNATAAKLYAFAANFAQCNFSKCFTLRSELSIMQQQQMLYTLLKAKHNATVENV